ncbi:hypothetical protein AMATHDRAFT_72107 [Amanita thiersii Skay4041]|uniref:Uncharacterized protein n=1 Tax=Amanita thiersii Skay4041 TaxID=703135 RepID=A0A2A9NAY1_9AGAR|nr:hypothetical protein AMATHDRAFT_72107 [Amanita thiersii Skay4041]
MSNTSLELQDQFTQQATLSYSASSDSSPIQCLSSEVLSEIFVHCLEKGTISNSVTDCPLLLCCVCSSWRTIALHTPRLWTTLDFQPCRTSCTAAEFVEHVHSWIKRSGDLPLKLKLDFGYSFEGLNWHDFADVILAAYLQYTSRWRSVKISFDDTHHNAMDRVLSNPIHAPRLRSFTFKVQDAEDDDFPTPKFSFPALTKFVWAPLTHSLDEINHIPWHQLTCVDIGFRISFSPALEILQRCPKLVSYSVDLKEVEEEEPQDMKPSPPIVHLNLHSLCLSFRYLCRCFFDRLVLPALHTLKIINESDEEFEEFQPYQSELLKLLTRSECKLEVLELHHSEINLTTLLPHNSCQTLRQLSFKSRCHEPFDDVILRRMTLQTGNQTRKKKKKKSKNRGKKQQTGVPLCPVLEHLDVEFFMHIATPGLLGRMILSRCSSKASGVTLNFVNICTVDLPPLDQELLEKVDRKVCKITVDYLHGMYDGEDDDFDEYQFNSDHGYGYDYDHDLAYEYNYFSESDDDYYPF